jgi:hypothetical protein
MFRRILRTIVLIPAAAVLVALAVANRQSVTISFDPFDPADPAYVLTAPFYLVGFSLLIAGVVLGGIATWFEQGKLRRNSARLAAELGVVRSELGRLKQQTAKARDDH